MCWLGVLLRSTTFAFAFALALGCGGPKKDEWQPGRSIVPVGPGGGAESRLCGTDMICPRGFVCATKGGKPTGECTRAIEDRSAPAEEMRPVEGPSQPPCASTANCPSRFRCDKGKCVR